ncbi:hypothetical protein GDO81_029105 [Engystomops pustulosus]|uniref:Uncharacterized protein n=1 Tax=Engystomops pustulosus TaxID=76066 RepID=A0AAV6ZKY9_ENGPU|nr:hypothetical protein GDO81_029105 [Engystomops pustulosus]
MGTLVSSDGGSGVSRCCWCICSRTLGEHRPSCEVHAVPSSSPPAVPPEERLAAGTGTILDLLGGSGASPSPFPDSVPGQLVGSPRSWSVPHSSPSCLTGRTGNGACQCRAPKASVLAPPCPTTHPPGSCS